MPQPRGNAKGLGHVNAKKMFEYTMQHGGGTFAPLGSPINPSFGFAISLDPDRTEVVPMIEFSPSRCEKYAMNNLAYVNEYNSEHAVPAMGLKMFGTWVHEGNVHLDVSTVIVTKDINKIMAMAADADQICVYDFATSKAVDVAAFYQKECDIEVEAESEAQRE